MVSLSPAPGVVVGGRFRLERPLGHGGMGAVWEAQNTATHRAVALKFLRGPAHQRTELRQRLLREARAATAVRHPNVVEVLDLFEHDEETPVMVMELLHGRTLRELLTEQETLDLVQTANVLLPVISALGTAHACGVAHRDLKPENIFLDESERAGKRVLVLDFGIAKLLDAQVRTDDVELVTDTGATLGTPCYMAPEQATAERDTDHRVDVWAMGVILYECLTGVRPIEGESVGQVLMRLMTTGIIPLERVLPDVPPDIAGMVGSMLTRERSHRAADLRSAHQVLSRHAAVSAPKFGPPSSEVSGNDLAAEAPRKTPAEAAPAPIPAKPRARRWLIAAVAAMVLVPALLFAASARQNGHLDAERPPSANAIVAGPSATQLVEAVLPPSTTRASESLPSATALAEGATPHGGARQEPRLRQETRPSSSTSASAGPRDASVPPAVSASSARRVLGGLEETPPF
jgi:eukaryotic-like serine/threonine-protein kinase